MTIYHVGGFNPFNRKKTLAQALAVAQDDDTIILHKNQKGGLAVNKNVIIQGQHHTLTVDKGMIGLELRSDCEIHNLRLACPSRSNAIVTEHNLLLDDVTITLTGPVREFYPLLWLKTKPNCYSTVKLINSTLLNVYSESKVQVLAQDSIFHSYYPGDVCLTSHADCSCFNGQNEFKHCVLRSIVLTGPSRLEACEIDRYLTVQNDATLTDCCLQVQTDCIPKRFYQCEPASGPLQDRIDKAKYSLQLLGSTAYQPQIEIQRLKLGTIRRDFYGIDASYVHVNYKQTNLTDQQLTNRLNHSSLSLKDTHDANFWQVIESPIACVRSTINASHKYLTAMEKLDQLIGQKAVKEQIKTIMNTIQCQQQTTNSDFAFSYNMIFAGEPGTGKSSIARIVAQALFEIGAIPENKFTAVSSDDLVKGYVGQSGENTRHILDQALGGVLFIDEAYQLTVKPGENSFNSDVISVLIRYMEEHRQSLVVIAAGYEQEMQEFLASNIGLSRRFQWIHFADYSDQELAAIFELMRTSYGDQYQDPQLAQTLAPAFAQLTRVNLAIPDARNRRHNGGNGGLVRNVYQATIQARNNRVVQTAGDRRISKEDLKIGFQVELDKAYARKVNY